MIVRRQKFLTISFIFIFTTNFNLEAQLRSYSNQADYIFITPSQFVNTLQPFISWRQNKDLNVSTVELQQIYSEFPDSTQQSSIRNFISHSLTYWSNPKPKYLLLIGNENLIPSYMVPSRFASHPEYNEDSVSVDEWYSVNLFEDNTNPDIAIGRFPVNNEQELNSVISKTMYFEDSLVFQNYPQNFLVLTDKEDFNMFEHYASKFINNTMPIYFSIDTIFAGQDSTIETTRENLFSALNNATLFFSYYGHGAPDRLSRYNIFTYTDIDSLKMNDLPFIYTSAACDQPFYLPNDSTIVRKLVILPRNGTVASVNSTGLNYLSQGSTFLTNFYENFFSEPDMAIGDAVLQTKIQLETYNHSVDAIPRRYTLLGDPALKLPLNTITKIVRAPENIPGSYCLYQNYPNPFNPSTTIPYSIQKAGYVSLKIYDLLGREICTLVDEYQNLGNYTVILEANDLSSGVYFYKIQVGNNFVKTKKMMFLK